MDNILNIQPPQKIYNILKHLNYKFWHALTEFVDNSIESYLNNKEELKKINSNYKLKIEIFINDTSKEIIIKDNAAGISQVDMKRAFTLAVEPEKKGLSEFGMGMKAAGCWFCDYWTVKTKNFDENFENIIKFDLKKIVSENITKLPYDKKENKSKESFTVITLSNVTQFPTGNSKHKIKTYLENVYRYYLSDNEIDILIDGKNLKFDTDDKISNAPYYVKFDEAMDKLLEDETLLDKYTYEELMDINIDNIHKYSKKIQEQDYEQWKVEINFEFYGKKVSGFVGILKKQSLKHSGLYLVRKKRVIIGGGYKPKEIFKSTNTQEYQRIFGQLVLDNFKVTHTKDDINWEGKEDEFIQILIKHIGSRFIKQAGNLKPVSQIRKLKSRLSEIYNERLEKEKSDRERAETEAEEERKKAEEEEEKRKAAEEKAKTAKKETEEAKLESKSLRTQNIFLKDIHSQNYEDIIKTQHHIKTYSDTVSNYLKNSIKESMKTSFDIQIIKSNLFKANYNNKQIYSITNIITKGGGTSNLGKSNLDLVMFVYEYLENIHKLDTSFIKINLGIRPDFKFEKTINSYEFSYLLDAFINNAHKKGAGNIFFNIELLDNNLKLTIYDDGNEFVNQNLEEIFEPGISTTGGSGLGLYDVKRILEKINGVIKAKRITGKGGYFEIIIIKNEN